MTVAPTSALEIALFKLSSSVTGVWALLKFGITKNIVSINNGDTVEIIIVKDGKSYSGEVKLSWPL